MAYPDCCDDADGWPCCPAAYCARYGHHAEEKPSIVEHCRICQLPLNQPPEPRTRPMTTTLTPIPVADLQANPNNVRQDANGDDLVPSIKAHGILTPLNVTAVDDGSGVYLVNAGHRRLDAAIKAGLDTVPCMIDNSLNSEADVTFAMLVENLQRADLSPVEAARGFARLVDLGVKQKEIAEHIGLSTSIVSRRIALLKLPDAALVKIHDGDLSLELAEQLTKLDPEVVDIAIEQGWNNWRIEQAVNQAKHQAEREAREAAEAKVKAEMLEAIEAAGLPHVEWNTVLNVTPIEGDEAHMWEPLQAEVTVTVEDGDDWTEMADQWIEHTPIELAAIFERADVEAVSIGQPEDPRLDWPYPMKVILLHRVPVVASTSPDGWKAQQEARARQTKREKAHFAEFLVDVAARNHKGADVAKWAMGALLDSASADTKRAALKALGQPTGQSPHEDLDTYLAGGLSGPDYLTLVTLVAVIGRDNWAMTTPSDVETASQLGWVPLEPPADQDVAA